jgi:hypothetical protein
MEIVDIKGGVMKGFVLLLFFLLSSVICSPQANSTGGKFKSILKSAIQTGKTDHAMILLDDDITMDKSFTSIRYELVYLGSENHIANFKQREYLSDDYGFFTKMGFSQNLSLNLHVSNILEYKGLKIEIISAEPQEISYRILTENEDQDVAASKIVKF